MRWLLAIVIVALPACEPPFRAPRPPAAAMVSSPGPLIRSHEKLACTDCHLSDSPLVAAGACTSCHPALVARIVANEGLHAKPAVIGQACTDCHRDHRGATYDARWAFFGGVARFDHTYTGWKLGKGHGVACDKCHPNANAAVPTFTGAAIACVSCHAPPHDGTPYAKLACESCHASTDRWTLISFDHDEKTRFDSGTSHRNVACARCHTTQLGAKSPARECATCHASRDPHAGRFGALGCERCHAPRMSFTPGQPPPAWKPNAFDHWKNTGWALVGRHATIECRDCHRAPNTPLFVPLGRGSDCVGCHEHRKVHDQKYSNAQCLGCHTLPG